MMSENDVLELLPAEKWPLIQEVLKKEWPNFAYYYYWIENAIKWKRKNSAINIKIYCLRGDHTCGTFIAISQFSIYIVKVFTQDLSGSTLVKILTETKYINWDESVHFGAVHERFKPFLLTAIDRVISTKRIIIEYANPAQYYFKPAQECAGVEICIPEECYMKALDKTHIPVIHNVWPHRDPVFPELSLKYLTTIIEMNFGIGLFLKEDNSLVSWAMQTDWHAMGIVQTVEQHQKKGYASIVINALAKKLAEDNISTALFIVKGNNNSQRLFHALGWKPIAPVTWIITKSMQKT
ncbi:hypothetical protein KM043_001156 [Ampulex compressa]|nr:hypothetical protein KM043_001156 [Ampulex compressa]